MLLSAIIAAAFLCFALPVFGTKENSQSLYISPSGAFRIEVNGSEAWVVYTKDASEKTRLPMRVEPEGDVAPDDEFHLSPNDEWIFAGRHVGSCLRAGDLYHRSSKTKIDIFESFNDLVWKNSKKLKILKDDYSAAGYCAMTFSGGWSADSSRLLIGLLGGEDKRDLHHCYLYFNTRTKEFETTNYLRKLNSTKSVVLACVEPIDPLPSEAGLKARFDALDKQLNETYTAKLKKMGQDSLARLRESQRAWLKARDAGLQLYLNSVPSAERERRKLQFLGDVATARIESLNQSDEEPFDFWERISVGP